MEIDHQNRRHRQNRRADRFADAVPHLARDGLLICRPTNSTTTTSSNEVTKANSAPEIMPGVISGMITLKNTVLGDAPRLAPARVSEWSNPDKVAVTVMITNGIPSVAWARMTPR